MRKHESDAEPSEASQIMERWIQAAESAESEMKPFGHLCPPLPLNKGLWWSIIAPHLFASSSPQTHFPSRCVDLLYQNAHFQSQVVIMKVLKAYFC